MSENKKFLLLILVILSIFAGEKLYKKLNHEKNIQEPKYEIKISRNTYEEKDSLLDLNTATVDEMLENGISLKYAEGIEEYRKITGGFESIEELKRIKGIGNKTFEKLSKKIKIYERPLKNKLYINEATDKILLYFGFTKKEIKKIRTHQKENFKINNNLEFRDILEEERYYYFEDFISYERY
jgi:competence protein ComEA